jgi:hypothetical protein
MSGFRRGFKEAGLGTVFEKLPWEASATSGGAPNPVAPNGYR